MVVLLWTSNYLSNQSELYVNILLLSILITWIFCKMRLTMTISVTVKCNHNFPVGWSFIIRRFPPRRVCYPHVGCYKANSLLNPATSVLPMSPDKIRPTFDLYTRQNKATAQLLNPYDSQTISKSGFHANRPTVLITHGFTDTVTQGWALTMKDALILKVGCWWSTSVTYRTTT